MYACVYVWMYACMYVCVCVWPFLFVFRADAANHSFSGGSFQNEFMQVPGVGDHFHSHTSLPERDASVQFFVLFACSVHRWGLFEPARK